MIKINYDVLKNYTIMNSDICVVYARYVSTGVRTIVHMNRRYDYYNYMKERIYGGIVDSKQCYIYVNFDDGEGFFILDDEVI